MMINRNCQFSLAVLRQTAKCAQQSLYTGRSPQHFTRGLCSLRANLSNVSKERLAMPTVTVTVPYAYGYTHSHICKHASIGFDREDVTVQGEIVFGTFPVLLALIAERRRVHSLYMKHSLLDAHHDRPRVKQILGLTEQLGVPVRAAQQRTLDGLSGGRPHQGVCLDAARLTLPCYTRDQHTGHGKDENRPELWIVLESIHDPMNFGAVLRSSYYLGVDQVFTVKGGSCPPSPVVSKASAGVLEVAPLSTVDSVTHFIKEKKSEGWSIFGTVGESQSPDLRTKSLSATRLEKNTLLIMGNEGGGLTVEVESLCDRLLTIEAGRCLVPHVESLNVSVAAGIILHHLLSHRG